MSNGGVEVPNKKEDNTWFVGSMIGIDPYYAPDTLNVTLTSIYNSGRDVSRAVLGVASGEVTDIEFSGKVDDGELCQGMYISLYHKKEGLIFLPVATLEDECEYYAGTYLNLGRKDLLFDVSQDEMVPIFDDVIAGSRVGIPLELYTDFGMCFDSFIPDSIGDYTFENGVLLSEIISVISDLSLEKQGKIRSVLTELKRDGIDSLPYLNVLSVAVKTSLELSYNEPESGYSEMGMG